MSNESNESNGPSGANGEGARDRHDIYPLDVRQFAEAILELRLVDSVQVGAERSEGNEYGVRFNPKTPTEFMATDGTHSHEIDDNGLATYKVNDDATYVLIIEKRSGGWFIKYAHFPNLEGLRLGMLGPEIRNFNGPESTEEKHNELETFLETATRQLGQVATD